MKMAPQKNIGCHITILPTPTSVVTGAQPLYFLACFAKDFPDNKICQIE